MQQGLECLLSQAFRDRGPISYIPRLTNNKPAALVSVVDLSGWRIGFVTQCVKQKIEERPHMLLAQHFLRTGPTHIGLPHAALFTKEKLMKALFRAQHHPVCQGSEMQNYASHSEMRVLR